MIAYQYQAKLPSGKLESGRIEGESAAAVRLELKGRGLFPLTVTESGGAVASRRRVRRKNRRVTKRDLMLMTTQLAIMNKAGIDLAQSLKNVARQATNDRLREAVQGVVKNIEDGHSFSAALGQRAHVFGEAYVAGIAAGEASGTLGQVLNRLNSLLRNEVRLRNTIKSIVTYPIILFLVALVVVNALIFFVLPQFAKVFRDMDRVPPAMTQMLLAGGEFVRENVLLVIVAIAGTVGALVVATRTAAFRRQADRLMLRLPGVSKATRPLLAGRMFRLIGTMVQSGVPLLDAIRLCRRSIANREYHGLFEAIEEELTKGSSISAALQRCEFLPDGAVEMISTSEGTGELGSVMELVGEFYEEEAERHVTDLAKILEPAIIVVMGGLVAMVVMAVILPLLDVSSSAGH